MRAAKDGSSTKELLSGLNFGSGVACDGNDVYFTALGVDKDTTGVLMKISLDGGTPTTLATGLGQPVFVKGDQKALYWGELASGDIYKLAK
jgi:hypothetical protein